MRAEPVSVNDGPAALSVSNWFGMIGRAGGPWSCSTLIGAERTVVAQLQILAARLDRVSRQRQRQALVNLIDVLWPTERESRGAAGVRRITWKDDRAVRRHIEELVLQARRGRRLSAERLQIEESIIGDARLAEEPGRERMSERQIDALVAVALPGIIDRRINRLTSQRSNSACAKND